MLDFAALKNSSQASLETLVKEAEKLTSRENSNDDRFWEPAVDKAGNGFAVIRFLPAPVGEDLPWVKLYDHGFQGPGGWYIENSLTTIGKDDPVSEHNSMLWNSGVDANKDIVSKGLPGYKGPLKRRMKYISNIMVIKDSANPENEGKVFLFRYGPKIFAKLQEAMKPQFEDEKPMNPFDFWNGADFKLKIRNVEGYRNYDKSEFDSPKALAKDSELEAIWKAEHSLAEFLDPKNFKSYEELKTRLHRVLGTTADNSVNRKMEDEVASAPSMKEAAAPNQKSMKEESAPWKDSEVDEDDLDFFKKLADDD